MAGPDGVVQAGRITDVSRKKALQLIAAGYAEEVKIEPKAKPKENTLAPPAAETTSTGEGAEEAPPAADETEDSDDTADTTKKAKGGFLGRLVGGKDKPEE